MNINFRGIPLILLLIPILFHFLELTEAEKKFKKLTKYERGGPQVKSIRKHMAVTTFLDSPSLNTICSPVSALMPLAKLVFGTTGRALLELEATLGMDKDHIRRKIPAFVDVLQNVKGVDLNIISLICLADTFKLDYVFEREVNEVFNSPIRVYDSSDVVGSVRAINAWVQRITENRIQNILNPYTLGSYTSLVLLSAVNFKGNWQKKFYAAEGLHIFHSPSGNVKVEMMSKVDLLKYKDSSKLNSKLVQIPYNGEEAYFLLVLPNRKNSLVDVLNKIDANPNIIYEQIDKMEEKMIELHIPKFKIETELNLEPLFTNLGVKKIFEPGSITKIAQTKLSVSTAIQKSLIEVNEEGTLADSISAMQIVGLSYKVPEHTVIAKNPFLFYIMVKGEQLFAGIFTGDSGEFTKF